MHAGRLPIALVHWTMVLNGIGVSALISLLPSVGRAAGIADPLIATVQALSALIWMLVATFWARMSDERGRRPLILIGNAGFTLANLVTAAAILVAVREWAAPLVAFTALLVGRGVFGLVGLAGVPAAQAFVTEHSDPERRATAIGALHSAQGFGAVIGPAITPLLLAVPGAGLATPMFAIAGLALLTMPFLHVLMPRDQRRIEVAEPQSGPRERLWRSAPVRALMLQTFLSMLALTGTMQAIGFLIIDTLMLAPRAAQPFVGWAMAAGAAASLFAQLALVRWLRTGARTLMVSGLGIAVSGAALLALVPSYALIVVGFVTLSLGIALARPGALAAASLAVPMTRQGEVAGMLLSAQSAGLVAGPMLSVTLYAIWQPLPFLLIALLLALAAGLAMRTGPAAGTATA